MLRARGHVLQLDEVRQDADQRHRLVDRQVGARRPRCGVMVTYRLASSLKRASTRWSSSGPLRGSDAQVVAGAVGDARRQRDLDVARRALGRALAVAALQLAVGPDGHRNGAVRGDDRAGRQPVGERHREARPAGAASAATLTGSASAARQSRPRARRTRPGTGRRSRRAHRPRRAGRCAWRRAPPARRRSASGSPDRSPPSRDGRSRRRCTRRRPARPPPRTGRAARRRTWRRCSAGRRCTRRPR